MGHQLRQAAKAAHSAAIRAWLAGALGVPITRVEDHHVTAWMALAADVTGHRPTVKEATSVRATAHQLQVIPNGKRETAADRHAREVAKVYGPRPLLRGERP